MTDKEIHYCDSMSGSGKTALQLLLSYLQEEYKNKKGGDFNRNEWKLVDNGNNVPQQQNCTDCGVFTCLNCIFGV